MKRLNQTEFAVFLLYCISEGSPFQIIAVVVSCGGLKRLPVYRYTCRVVISYIFLSFVSIGFSKKISNDQELIQSDPTSCPQNQKRNN